MTDGLVEVWGTGTPRTLRVYWALEELGLAYQRHSVRTRTSDMEAPSFLAISPGKKIPAITHGGLKLRESGAIIDYLYGYAERAPASLELAAEIEQWSCFVLMEMDATALYVLRRHRGLPEIYGEAENANDAAVAYFLRQASVVSEALSDGREFIVGDTLSKADIILASCCLWSQFEKIPLPGPLASYSERLFERPAYQRAVSANKPDPA